MVGLYAYNSIWGSNVIPDNAPILFIPENASYESLEKMLVDSSLIEDPNSFALTAKLMRFEDSSIKPGRYETKGLHSNRDLLGLLRSGRRSPINLTISQARTIQQFAGNVSEQMSFDSTALLSAIRKESSDSSLYIAGFIPNTYEVYWRTSPEGLLKRLYDEYDAFWSKENRADKLESLKMSKDEVMTLASIVEKETNYNPEKKRIAGVYMNRLRLGMHLQADPTVVYGLGDFTIRRVLNKHLLHDSPYNTYLYPGLPPGPICLPSISSIDAVLSYEDHKYLYFCAKPGYEGQHAFAKHLREHNKNASVYQRWLSSEGIR